MSGKKFETASDLFFLVEYTDTGYLLFDPRTKERVQGCNMKIDESRSYRDIYPPADSSIVRSLSPTVFPDTQSEQVVVVQEISPKVKDPVQNSSQSMVEEIELDISQNFPSTQQTPTQE